MDKVLGVSKGEVEPQQGLMCNQCESDVITITGRVWRLCPVGAPEATALLACMTRILYVSRM